MCILQCLFSEYYGEGCLRFLIYVDGEIENNQWGYSKLKAGIDGGQTYNISAIPANQWCIASVNLSNTAVPEAKRSAVQSILLKYEGANAINVYIQDIAFWAKSVKTTDISGTQYWDNVKIGGGGKVTGLAFSPSADGTVYARTDVGGAYRYDTALNEWVPLMDAYNKEYRNFYGIDGIAVDPQNPDTVYAAAGTVWYRSGESNKYSDVLKSTNGGKTWTETDLNKMSNGNLGEDRIYGESLVVDPSDSNTIYCGTRYDGLWISRNGADTWTAANGIPTLTLPTGEIHPDFSGVRSVAIDADSNDIGGRKSKVYAAVDGYGVYASTDGGDSWGLMSGSPVNVKCVQVLGGKVYALAVANSVNSNGGGLYCYNGSAWKI